MHVNIEWLLDWAPIAGILTFAAWVGRLHQRVLTNSKGVGEIKTALVAHFKEDRETAIIVAETKIKVDYIADAVKRIEDRVNAG